MNAAVRAVTPSSANRSRSSARCATAPPSSAALATDVAMTSSRSEPPASSSPSATSAGSDPVANAAAITRRGSAAIGGLAVAGVASGSKRRILLENRALDITQSSARLDSELRNQRPARRLERLQRVGLAATAIQGHHLLRPKALVQRMPGDQRVELRDQLGVAPAREIRVDRTLQRGDPQLVQARCDGPGARLLGEIGESRSAPERERGAELFARNAKAPVGERPRPGARPALEDLQVQRAVGDRDDVSPSPSRDRIAAQGLAQLRHVGLQHVPRGDRRVAAPDLVHQTRDRHDLVRVHEQDRQ